MPTPLLHSLSTSLSLYEPPDFIPDLQADENETLVSGSGGSWVWHPMIHYAGCNCLACAEPELLAGKGRSGAIYPTSQAVALKHSNPKEGCITIYSKKDACHVGLFFFGISFAISSGVVFALASTNLLLAGGFILALVALLMAACATRSAVSG